jgi:signal transduction histidine kinase
MEQQTGTECLCQAGEDVQVPDEHTAIQLYRIAQEALSNAVRHGRASRVVVSLRVDDGGLRLEIHDDGVGLGGEGASAQGAGLRIMRYRAGTLGGSLEVGPRDGGGTVVRCRIPGRAAS